MVAMITDALIIFLLIGGIVFAYIVNARVNKLMLVLRELKPAVREFSSAVDRSEASVLKMKEEFTAKETQVRTNENAEGAPQFSTRRANAEMRDIGVQVIRNKQDLVRQFFDLPRTQRQV